MSAKELETPGTHVEVWRQPEDTMTISLSMAGAPLEYEWLQRTLKEAATAAKAEGKVYARIFINHVKL